GTSSAGEGNVLLSDKVPGPELALAMRGVELWHELARDAAAGGGVEFEAKGGLLVAHDEDELDALSVFARSQRELGVHVELVGADALHELEPSLAEGLSGGAFYDEDCQVQPMLAVDYLVRQFRAHGGRLVRGAGVVAAETDGQGNVRSVRTTRGTVAVGRCAVNAAGPWAREVAQCFGTDIPVEPRRGHVLVTEPLPPLLVRHKVCEAGYVGTVHDSITARACSSVVEATRSGTILLGSSREFVGFSPELDLGIVRTIAARGISLFPSLAGARLMRAYVGFRPTTPDRLPIIGADTRVGGLYHATGHEGAGIGLALVTAELMDALVRDEAPPLDVTPFAPMRFTVAGRSPLSGHLPVELSGEVPGPEVPVRLGIPVAAERPPAPTRVTPSLTVPRPRGDGAPPATSPLPQLLHFRFDGRELAAPWGTTIAGALLSNGERAWRTTRTGGQLRGLFCGIGTCFDCLVDVNGEKAVRACLAVLSEGDEIHSSASVGLAGA
ncbi:MAG TPA: FAD-dependent oxidoreductase, partial [Acidimicrobiales bacterium]|nr:FAD-dependent oxidoreductase [Acidimicrobiales bacterium]